MDEHKITVALPGEGIEIRADLVRPQDATAVVVFAHGTGSGRHSPRNRHVAAVLQDAALATLLVDLLTEAEEDVELHGGMLRFDVDMLAGRLHAVAAWTRRVDELAGLPLGYFGASTGAAAALIAAAEHTDDRVAAVVSRGGRVDLARDWLRRVGCPTLLIVGEHDRPVVELNRRAFAALQVEKNLAVVPRADHLFEEPGALDEVADLARAWFADHLAAAATTR